MALNMNTQGTQSKNLLVLWRLQVRFCKKRSCEESPEMCLQSFWSPDMPICPNFSPFFVIAKTMGHMKELEVCICVSTDVKDRAKLGGENVPAVQSGLHFTPWFPTWKICRLKFNQSRVPHKYNLGLLRGRNWERTGLFILIPWIRMAKSLFVLLMSFLMLLVK